MSSPSSSFEKREEIREAISRFGRAFIHDLNNPLGGVSGYLELLGDAVKLATEQGKPLDVPMMAELTSGLDTCVERLGVMMTRARQAIRPTQIPGGGCSPAELREAILDLGVHGEYNIAIADEAGFLSREPCLPGDARDLAGAIRQLTETVASFTRSPMGQIDSARSSDERPEPDLAEQIPSSLLEQTFLRVTTTIFRAKLQSADIECLFFPVNLRRNDEAPECGWGFATGYNTIRCHGGGVAVRNAAKGFEVHVYLPLRKSD